MGKGGSHLRREPQPQRRSESNSRSDAQPPRRSQPTSESSRRTASSQPPRRSAAPSPRRSDPPSPSQNAAPPRVQVTPPRSDRPAPDRRTPPPAGRTPSRRRKRRGGFPLWPVIALLVAVIAVSLFMLGKTILGYTSNRADYNNIQNAAIIPRLPEQTTQPDEAQPDKPVVRSEIPFDVDWDMLRQTNSEIIGWLYCPDTVINYPLVQTSDNDKYLTTNFSGKQNAGGALFADYNSVIGIRASHLIIYGHNMKDNSMFGTLKNYGDEAYFRAHPVFYLLTPDQAYRIDLLDCLTIDATLDNYPTYFGEGGSLESYVGRITSGAYWVNHEADYQNHQLVTMSTCTSSDDERLILQGVLVPIE